ncbi:hypothetical protein K440DRAFT_608947 [Wilcoxina mikolae CBS 423.85]|nr:hypothetical protein K440DRAFT_608947 [Wilcoxina mikolae CBS 423.85]
MATEPIPPLWRRRRKPRFDFIALLLYTLTVVLVPPWAAVLAGASEAAEEGPGLYTEKVSLEGFGFGFGDIVDEATLDRRSSFTREEQNGVVRPQNIGWGDSWVHHLSATEIFDNGDDGDQRRKREAEAEAEVVVEKRQQQSKTVHITFNTCLQPVANATAEDGQLQPPQLQVFVSNSTRNKSPGPEVQGKVQYVMPIDGGFGSLDITVTGDIWVGVYAVRLPSAYKGLWNEKPPWNYELALSTDEPYHGFQENQFLYLVDTDDSSALLVTGNMTDHSSLDGGTDESVKDLMDPSYTPYTMYAQNRNTTSRFKGLEKSYCAVRQLAQIRPANTDVSMTTRGLGNLPKQQFHLKELNRSSEYWGYLARPRNNSASDTSGILWKPLQLNTKKDGNCQIIYNLPFCSEVAYAVPSNPTVFGDLNNLTTFYDDLAKNWWQNFTYSLQQIQCNASNSAQYSLIRNCDDCAAAYKNWLCAVTIPRCMDYSSDLPYLAERSSNKLFWNATVQGWQKHPWMPTLSQDEVNNWTNSGGWLANGNQSMSRVPSRNVQIDEIVKPGAYKEVRPCKDLCWTLVQSCPSPLGFSCPRDGTWGKEMSYGERDSGGDVTCSYLGAVYALSSAPPRIIVLWWMCIVVLATIIWSSWLWPGG